MPNQANLDQDIRREWRGGAPLMGGLALLILLQLALGGTASALPTIDARSVLLALETLTLVELFLAFGLLWFGRQNVRSAGPKGLAAALFAAALLEFMHIQSSLDAHGHAGLTSAFASVARWLQALGLVAAAYLPARRPLRDGKRLVMLAVAVAAAILVGTHMVDLHPGSRSAAEAWPTEATPAAWLLDCAVMGLFLSLGLRLHRDCRAAYGVAAGSLGVACVLSALSALADLFGGRNDLMFEVLTHAAKLGAAWYLMRGSYLMTVREPLRASAALAAALETTSSAALICTRMGRIRWANPAFLQRSGLSIDALRQRHLLDLSASMDAGAAGVLQQALAQELPWRGRVQTLRDDGQVFIQERNVTPVRNAQGQVDAFVVIDDDVTDREQVIARLSASEQAFRALFEWAPDAIVVVDTTGRILRANPAVTRLFGYDEQELLGHNVTRLMPDDSASAHGGHLARYLAGGPGRIIGKGRDVRGRTKLGNPVDIHLTVNPALLPEGQVFIGFMRDVSARAQAQASLQAREAQYRALMVTAIDGIWICDREGRILSVNDAYCRRSGYSRAELLRMFVADLEATENPAEVSRHIEAVITKGHDTFESLHRSKSGDIWPVEIAATFGPEQGGQFYVFVRDLTERHAAARALKATEERFRLALGATMDGLWDDDLLAGTLYLSPRWKEMLGYADAELANEHATFNRLLHPGDAFASRAALDDILAGRSDDRIELEIRLRHKDGHWVYVLSRGRVLRDEAGRAVRVIGTNQDLTERRHAEAALRASEDKLRNLFELSALGIALCRMDGKLVEFNEAFRQITGYKAQELRELTYWDLTPSEYMRAEDLQLSMIAESGRYGPYEKEYQRKDGTRVPVKLNGVRIDIEGQAHLWSIVEDMTAARRVEAQRQDMQRQQMQSQKLEALGHLAGGIAHDFNNMLAGIMGLADLGLERHGPELPPKISQYLREIVRTSERGRDLVTKMLTYVRSVEPEAAAPQDMAAILHEMYTMLQSSIPSSITIQCQSAPDLPPVRIPVVDMHQIIMNLVLNARDAIAGPGSIDLTLSRRAVEQDHCAQCQAQLEGDFVLLEVADSGAGIPPELLQKIFNPFFTTKEVGKGTGLGLSSVIGLVHKAGGHLTVMPRMPRGTVMQVWLPVAEGAAEQLPDGHAVAARGHNEMVWVVDDDPAVLVYLTELLRENGYAVTAFPDSAEAVDMLARLGEGGAAPERPLVLITDQTMPRVTGTELAHAARMLKPPLPVILCTGYSEVVDAGTAESLGINAFLRKPFHAQDLLGEISTIAGSTGH